MNLQTLKYFNNLCCNWIIKADKPQKIIKLKINFIELEEKNDIYQNDTTTLYEFASNNNLSKKFENFESRNCYDFITVYFFKLF